MLTGADWSAASAKGITAGILLHGTLLAMNPNHRRPNPARPDLAPVVRPDNINTLPHGDPEPAWPASLPTEQPQPAPEHDTDNLNVPSIKHPSHQQWGKISGGWHQYR